MQINNESIQCHLFFHRDDTIAFLDELERRHRVRYIPAGLYETANIPIYTTRKDPNLNAQLGYSPFGDPFSPNLLVEFPPFSAVIAKPHPKGFERATPACGGLAFCPGGLYRKTGEHISGILSYARWSISKNRMLDSDFYFFKYEECLDICRAQGARKYKSYLIGPSAWEAFRRGDTLIQVSGTKTHLG